MLFQKTAEMREIFNQPREAMLRQDGATYYAARGERTRLVFAPQQGCRIDRQSEARSNPPVWIVSQPRSALLLLLLLLLLSLSFAAHRQC